MSKNSSSYESVSGKMDTRFPTFGDHPLEPISLLREWLHEAELEKVREPRSMVFVTSNNNREMTSRVMAVLESNDDGIVFATHNCSRKIKDITQVPYACGHFYWRELGRQLSVGGVVTELPRETAESVWNNRPVPLHSMSTVSRQSEKLESREALQKAALDLDKKGALPCPKHFSVYLLCPKAVEFWAASSDRLHRRLRFEQQNVGWESVWLEP